MVSGQTRRVGLLAILAAGLIATEAAAGSGTVEFSGRVPERGRAALTVVAASPASLSAESGLQLVSRNTTGRTIRRVFSVSSMAGKAMAAEIWPDEAVMRPGEMRRVSVFVPFGDASSHRYRVCVGSFDLSGASLGHVCTVHAARRIR